MPVSPRGRGFQVAFKLPGWPRVRAQFATHEEATAYEMTARAAHALGKPCPPADHAEGSSISSKGMTIKELAERCDERRWSKLESGHGPAYARNAYMFAEWAGPKLPVASVLTEDKIVDYVEHREVELNNSGSTINRHMAALSVLVKEASKLKLIEPFKLPRRKEGQCRIRVFSEAEERAIQATARQWGYQDLADFFIFLADTGCRSGEARKLLWSDFQGRKIILEQDITKNSTQRVLSATPRVAEVLARMKERYVDQPGPFAWVTERAIRTLWDRLRGHLSWMNEDTIPYTYRHTCASRLVQRGVDLYRVQIWMGHKSMAMTQRYAKFAPKHLEELADVLSRPVLEAAE